VFDGGGVLSHLGGRRRIRVIVVFADIVAFECEAFVHS